MSEPTETAKSRLRIGRMNVETETNDPMLAKRLARRVAELLGEGLAGGTEVRPRRQAIVDVSVPAGLTGEKLAEFVAQEIQRRLG
jgi:hypothetical protein